MRGNDECAGFLSLTVSFFKKVPSIHLSPALVPSLDGMGSCSKPHELVLGS